MASNLLPATLFLLAVAASAHFISPKLKIPTNLQVRPNFSGTCSAKDQVTTRTCLDAYFSLFSIDSSQTLPEYFDYAKKMASVVEMYGVIGIDIYCNFEATLESCMGPLMNSPCMNPDMFSNFYGIDQGEASEYATSFQIESYTCLNAETSKKYFECMNIGIEDNIQSFLDCSNTMTQQLQNATDPCIPMSNYVYCIEDFYVELCDEGIRGYICNSQEIAFDFMVDCKDKLPKCDA